MNVKENLAELAQAPLANWVLYVIADDAQLPVLDAFVELCINKNVLYVCATGAACSEIDDLFDWNMVLREKEALPSWYKGEEDVLMTTWHHNFEDGFWFVTTVATYGDHPIDMVLVVNLTGSDDLPRILDLTNRIRNGWLPPQ